MFSTCLLILRSTSSAPIDRASTSSTTLFCETPFLLFLASKAPVRSHIKCCFYFSILFCDNKVHKNIHPAARGLGHMPQTIHHERSAATPAEPKRCAVLVFRRAPASSA